MFVKQAHLHQQNTFQMDTHAVSQSHNYYVCAVLEKFDQKELTN
jgi:hypothetical protein